MYFFKYLQCRVLVIVQCESPLFCSFFFLKKKKLMKPLFKGKVCIKYLRLTAIINKD